MIRRVRNRDLRSPNVMTMRSAKVVPARDEQHQGGEEQQEFGKGWRQEFERWLHPFELGQMERCARQRIGSAEHALHLLPQRQRAVEHMKLVLHQRAELGKPRRSIR